MLQTDYLVIGAGAAALSFVDTLLSELPDAKIIIVDKHAAPGGHWNDAYGHVHLHQPSLLYGVASKSLEGDWASLIFRKGTLPWQHRASKKELLTYYQELMDQWIAQGSVQYFPRCAYDFASQPQPEDSSQLHYFSSCDDSSKSYKVKVNVKLVNASCGENKVPSQCPPEFPVDENVKLVTPNDLYNVSVTTNGRKRKQALYNQETFVVMGAGKTAMDAVVFLLRDLKVHPDQICWIKSNDVWVLRREGSGSPSSWPRALLKTNLDPVKAALYLEARGDITRVDKTVMPTKFRFPVVGQDELNLMRKIKNVVRQGRVRELKTSDGKVCITMEKGDEPLYMDRMNTTFVHCTSPGPFNGNIETDVFPSDKEIRTRLLFAPPLPISMSCIAVFEARYQKGLLDMELGHKMVQAKLHGGSKEKKLSDMEVLNELIHGYAIGSQDDFSDNTSSQLKVFYVIFAFYALFDKEDPGKALNWMKQNRLSMESIPGVPCRAYEVSRKMMDKHEQLNLPDGEVKMLSLVADKLMPLEGK